MTVEPVASAADAYFEVTQDQVRLIAGASDLRILTSGPDPTNFELWDNQASAFRSLRQFTDQAAYCRLSPVRSTDSTST